MRFKFNLGMRFVFLPLLLLMFLEQTLGKPAPQASAIDSLLSVLAGQESPENRETLLILSEAYFSKDLDSSFFYIRMAFDEVQEMSTPQAMQIKGQYAKIQIERLALEGIEDILQDLITYYTEQRDTAKQADTYNDLGRYYFNNKQHKHEQALEAFRKKIELEKILGDSVRYGKALANFALMLDAMGSHDNAMDAYRQALKTLLSAREMQDVLKLYFNISYAYGIENRPYFNLDSAILYGREGIDLAQNMNFPFGIAKCQGVVSSALIRKGKTNPEYLQEGLNAAKASKAFFKDTPFKVDYYHAWLYEGFAEEALGNGYAAITIAEDLLATDYPDESECHRLLHLAHKRVGNYQQALKYLEFHRDYTDSVVTRNLTKELAELQTKYDTEKKDQRIQALSQQSAMQNLELRQRKIILFGSIFTFIILAIAAFFWYKKRVAEKDRKLIDIEQRALQLQMNPHFIFNTLGVIQHLLHENSPEKAGIFLAKFSKLMRQILEFSREDFILLEDEVALLENYIQLQKLSSGQEFDHTITIDEQIIPSEVRVPPMFAQPFIENAIEHGQIGAFEDGKLEIHFTDQRDKLGVEVRDNGIGISPKQTKKRQSLATQITKERLGIFEKRFKMPLSFIVEDLFSDKQRKGTRMKLQVPFTV